MRAAVAQAPELAISRSASGTLLRYAAAVGVMLAWLGFAAMDAVLSLMFWTEPNPEVLIYTSPMLAVIPWILQMAGARGYVVAFPDHLEIRHRRLLKRPIFLDRPQVNRILLADDSTAGWGSFSAEEGGEPGSWTDPRGPKQNPDRPVFGDGVLPNLSIALTEPLATVAARSSFAALTASRELPPPRRDGRASVLLLAMEDPVAVRAALADWPIEEVMSNGRAASAAAAADQAGRDAAVLVMLATATATLLLVEPALAMAPLCISVATVVFGVRRRRRADEIGRGTPN